MTIISTLLTRFCTTHASDSFITVEENGKYSIKESQRTKIMPVKHWRGAFTYWGLAESTTYKWSTYEWLLAEANHSNQYSSAEEFAATVADKLNDRFAKMRFKKPLDKGIGIHFTVYEYINDYWIPELFLISNWADPMYASLRPEGIGYSRETYHATFQVPPDPKHREIKYRLDVYNFLQQGGILGFNNGDPEMYVPTSNAILNSLIKLNRRKSLITFDSYKPNLSFARRPIEIVSEIQRDFCIEGKRLVGGKPHDYAIRPTGETYSTTGDN